MWQFNLIVISPTFRIYLTLLVIWNFSRLLTHAIAHAKLPRCIFGIIVMMISFKIGFQARHTKLIKFMIGAMKSEIPKFPEFSLKMRLHGKPHIIYSNLLILNQTSLTVSRILRCSVSPNVVNWLSFLKVAPEWSAWFKNFSSTWQRPLIRKLIVEFFAKVLECFETLEFYLEKSNIYNEDFLSISRARHDIIFKFARYSK